MTCRYQLLRLSNDGVKSRVKWLAGSVWRSVVGGQKLSMRKREDEMQAALYDTNVKARKLRNRSDPLCPFPHALTR